MGVIANQCRNTGVAIPQKFPRTNRKLARAAIGRPLFCAFSRNGTDQSLPLGGWCSAQRIKILMTASGSHTLM